MHRISEYPAKLNKICPSDLRKFARAEVLGISGERQVSTESVAMEMAEDILRGSNRAREGADRSLAA